VAVTTTVVTGIAATVKETAMTHAAIEMITTLADVVKTEILVVAAKIETLVVIGVAIVDAAAKI
jgi:hypothetical protein